MEKNMVVPDWSSVTANQMKEFWEKASPDRKQIGSRNFQNFLDNPNRYSPDSDETLFVSLTRAKKILGRHKVVTVTNFNKVWKTGHDEVLIFYSENDLEEASYRNKAIKGDWRLVYYSGLSIRQLNKIIGTDRKHQPCFYEQDWYFKTEEDFWADKVPPAGYYLINFKGLLPNLDYKQQETEIAFRFGENFKQTDPHIFIEAAMTIFKVTGERIANNWYHRSSVCTASGRHVYLGDPDSGWIISDFWEDAFKGILLVFISQEQNVELIIKEKIDIQKI